MAISAMLTKKEGVTLVDKLRTIVLFMVDYNDMNTHIGRQYGTLRPTSSGTVR
jgi:hypothetical protein